MIGKILSGLFGGGIKQIGEAVDSLVTSDEEKMKLKKELVRIQAEAAQEAERIGLQYEQELTERHKADMASDAWLPKNIRPLSLVFLLGVVSILAFFDGNVGQFSIKEDYIGLYENLLLLAFGFYFGSRGVEKVVKTWKR